MQEISEHKIAKHDTLCYIDSDLIISSNSIINLIRKN